MRIAISVNNKNGLDSPVNLHFGRCPCFVLVDVEGRDIMTVSSVDNPFSGQHAPGQVPEFISSLGANVMLAGGMGHRAIAFFQQYGIEPVSGASGTAGESLQRYLDSQLKGAESCAESRHHDR